MQTYIKTTDSTEYAAIRATRREIRLAKLNVDIVKATAKLRELARNGCIPTYRIMDDGKLGGL